MAPPALPAHRRGACRNCRPPSLDGSGPRHHMQGKGHAAGRPTTGDTDMFDRREDLERLLAVAEAGKIHTAAARLSMTQPALTRTIARLERQFGGRLFERLPTGVRPTPFGEQVIALARAVMREIVEAQEKIGMAVSGRAGKVRVTATPVWMEAVLAPSAVWLRERLPGLEFGFRTVTPPEGLRLLEAGRSDLHCGGLRDEVAVPDYLRCERFLDMTRTSFGAGSGIGTSAS